MYFRRKQSQGRIYLQIVESHRSGDQVRQRVIATLGRLDELEASGQLDRLLRSGARLLLPATPLDAISAKTRSWPRSQVGTWTFYVDCVEAYSDSQPANKD